MGRCQVPSVAGVVLLCFVDYLALGCGQGDGVLFVEEGEVGVFAWFEAAFLGGGAEGAGGAEKFY